MRARVRPPNFGSVHLHISEVACGLLEGRALFVL